MKMEAENYVNKLRNISYNNKESKQRLNNILQRVGSKGNESSAMNLRRVEDDFKKKYFNAMGY